MRIASLKTNDLAAVQDSSFILIGETLVKEGLLQQGASLIDFISSYASIKDHLGTIVEKCAKTAVDYSKLKPPVEHPSKIWAAAGNYKRGSAGLDDARGRGTAGSATQQEILENTFLKPPSAIVGPEEKVIIPKGAQTIFPELELCAVIGKESKNLPREQALEAVFGYTIILDVTARGYGAGKSGLTSRCVRKGFNTFAPLGPWITTSDEIDDPQNLLMRLWVNDDLVQSARTDGMTNGVADLVSYLSEVGTLYPGDLIATGNPDAPQFQRQLVPGDRLKAEIEGIGVLNLSVAAA